jgi:hypothetical protein
VSSRARFTLRCLAVALAAHACGGQTVTSEGSSGGTSGGFAGHGTGGSAGAEDGGTGGLDAAIGGSGAGGVDAGGSGGSAASGGFGAFGGSGSGVQCGNQTCPSYLLGGSVELSGCCFVEGECGILVDESIPIFVLSPGCHAILPIGPTTSDAECPPMGEFTNPVTGQFKPFSSCCQPSDGTCGIAADLTWAGGPNIGCIDPGMPWSGKPCSTD